VIGDEERLFLALAYEMRAAALESPCSARSRCGAPAVGWGGGWQCSRYRYDGGRRRSRRTCRTAGSAPS
jgi:hypothetical protein